MRAEIERVAAARGLEVHVVQTHEAPSVRCAGGISHHADRSITSGDVAAAIDAVHAAVLAVAAQFED